MSVRARRAARLSVLLLFSLCVLCLPAADAVGDDPEALLERGLYFDVPSDAWYAPAAAWARTSGVLAGTAKSIFCPDEPLSRSGFLDALYRLEGSPMVVEGSRFIDTSPASRTTLAVIWAEQSGLVTGVAPGLLDPDAPVTREQAALILYRLEGLPALEAVKDPPTFPDLAQVSPWAAEAVEWAVAGGLLLGTGGYLDPDGPLTRAQGVVLLQRYDQYGDR